MENFVNILEVVVWPATIIIVGLVIYFGTRVSRYSSPSSGPSGRLIRHDRKRDVIQVWDWSLGMWIDK
jgi:hypothetical protein